MVSKCATVLGMNHSRFVGWSFSPTFGLFFQTVMAKQTQEGKELRVLVDMVKLNLSKRLQLITYVCLKIREVASKQR